MATILATWAGAQTSDSFVYTKPGPARAGEAFEVAFFARVRENTAGASPTVRLVPNEPTLLIGMNRACVPGPGCVASGFIQPLSFNAPALPAGTYLVVVYEGEIGVTEVRRFNITIKAETFQGQWWKAPAGSESGWGLSIDHQGDILYAVWFTYDSSGKAAWYVMSRGEKTGNDQFSGPLYRTVGTPQGGAWNQADLVATPVGTATFRFTARDAGQFEYTLDGTQGSAAITRFGYATPVARCVPD